MIIRKLYEAFWVDNIKEKQKEVEELKSGSSSDFALWIERLLLGGDTPKEYNILTPLSGTIQESFWDFGLDTRKNLFINFIADSAQNEHNTMKSILSTADAPKKFQYLYTRWKAKDFRTFDELKKLLNHDFILNLSLWDRSFDDFVYAFQALLLLSDKNAISEYFDNPDVVDLKKLFSGNDIQETERIKNLINEWSSYNNEDKEKDKRIHKTDKKENEKTVADIIRSETDKSENDRITKAEVTKYILNALERGNQPYDADTLLGIDYWIDGMDNRDFSDLLSLTVDSKYKAPDNVLHPVLAQFRREY